MKANETKEEQILIRITGKDRPGLTASVMEILARKDAKILDIGQADIHSTLSLGILIRIGDDASGQVMKELLFKATELGVNIGFAPVTDEEYENWVNRQGKHRYILTIIGRTLSASQIEAATKVIAKQGLNIDSILRLTGRMSIMHPERNMRACIEFSLRGTPENRAAMQEELMRISSEMGIDFSFQRMICIVVCADSSALIWILPLFRQNVSTNLPIVQALEPRFVLLPRALCVAR